MTRRIAFNESLCTSCNLCAMYCSITFSKKGIFEFRPHISRIKVVENDDESKYAAHVCLQCENPPCVKACPEKAIVKDAQTGIVNISDEKCTGCGSCVTACPYDCVFIADSLAIKCQVCDDPLCVRACARKALSIVDDVSIKEQAKLYREVRL